MKLLKTGPIIRCTHGKSNAASLLSLKNVCRSLNSVKLLLWVAKKRQPAKEDHLDSIQCRSFAMILLHSTGITYSMAIPFHLFIY